MSEIPLYLAFYLRPPPLDPTSLCIAERLALQVVWVRVGGENLGYRPSRGRQGAPPRPPKWKKSIRIKIDRTTIQGVSRDCLVWTASLAQILRGSVYPVKKNLLGPVNRREGTYLSAAVCRGVLISTPVFRSLYRVLQSLPPFPPPAPPRRPFPRSGYAVRTVSGRARLGRDQKSFIKIWDIGLFRARSIQKGSGLVGNQLITVQIC